jgi:phenylalanine-4-hydroxylase
VPDGGWFQDWSEYSEAEHATWRALYGRQRSLAERCAARAVREALDRLDCADGIPSFETSSRRLVAATGWTLTPVPGLIPDREFFALLAERRFPVTTWIRSAGELDYIAEPDVFHDFFGHVPLLFHHRFAEFLRAYGRAGLAAPDAAALKALARLYWYTVEFGLVREEGRLGAIGAGLVSSHAELAHAVESPVPLRIRFDVGRVLRTDYRIDRFQETYVVLDGFDDLLGLASGLEARVAAAKDRPAIAPGAAAPGDAILRS